MTKKKILIIDDDQDIRHGLNVRLRANDYDVIHAEDAVSAIRVAQNETPDLILLDIGLPGGDGFAVMDWLKTMPSLACVPVIVVSARDPLVSRDRALAAGARAFLQKPVDNGRLLDAIRGAWTQKAPGLTVSQASRKKILIVDDDQDIRHGLNVRLRANNYETAYAGDAVWALSKVQKEKPDLVLLDIGLPGGDGFLVMERMKALPSFGDVPVIVVSARDPLVSRDRALAAGARAFLQKPVDNGRLLDAIRDALEGPAFVGDDLYLRAA